MTDTLDRSINRADDGLCDTPDHAPDDDTLIARYIESDPRNLGPSEARIADHGVSVWALVAYLQAVGNDAARVATDYGLEPQAVEAAIRYYCRHQPLIDARILIDRSSFAS